MPSRKSPLGDGRMTASGDKTARVWEADTGKPVGAPLQHQAAVYSAAFSPDGRRLKRVGMVRKSRGYLCQARTETKDLAANITTAGGRKTVVTAHRREANVSLCLQQTLEAD